MRCRLIDLAASLDRIERGERSMEVAGDARLGQIKQALAVLAGSGPEWTEKVQMLFSDPYVSEWRTTYGL